MYPFIRLTGVSLRWQRSEHLNLGWSRIEGMR